jgi:putative endonuclease
MKKSWVYILSNRTHNALYTGVTSNLEKRLWEHRHKIHPKSFTTRYHIDKLVYIEECSSIEEAIIWEKKIKGKSRKNKVLLIERNNPTWVDLSEGWYE